MFSWASDSGLLDDNPMLGVKRPTREGKGKTRVLNDQEIRPFGKRSSRSRPCLEFVPRSGC